MFSQEAESQDPPNGSQSKALAQRLRDAQIRVLLHKRNCARLLVCEVDVRLIDDDNALELLKLEHLAYRS